MSSSVNGNSVKLTRGDSLYLSVPIWEDETEETLYVPKDGDTVRFALKHAELLPDGSDFTDAEPLVEKELEYDSGSGMWELHLVPADTKDLGFGSYVYDVQLSTDGDDFTFIANAKFKLTPEVE